MKPIIKNILSISLSVTIVLGALPACKKYEDGPFISLRTKKERVANTWKVDSYYLNDTNQTATIDTWLPNYTQTFTVSGNYSFNTSFVDGSGTWDFIDNKEGIRIVVNGILGDEVTDVTILKLKENEFWYYYSEGEDKHEFHLIPG